MVVLESGIFICVIKKYILVYMLCIFFLSCDKILLVSCLI